MSVPAWFISPTPWTFHVHFLCARLVEVNFQSTSCTFLPYIGELICNSSGWPQHVRNILELVSHLLLLAFPAWLLTAPLLCMSICTFLMLSNSCGSYSHNLVSWRSTCVFLYCCCGYYHSDEPEEMTEYSWLKEDMFKLNNGVMTKVHIHCTLHFHCYNYTQIPILNKLCIKISEITIFCQKS